MTPTPKELLAAAGTVASYLGRGGWYAIDREADLCARYILASVLADDDEPATIANGLRAGFMRMGNSITCGFISVSYCDKEQVYKVYAGNSPLNKFKQFTLGDFRTLCRVLGITLPEVQA